MPSAIWSQRGDAYATEDDVADVKTALAAEDWYEYEPDKWIRSVTIMRIEDTPAPE